MVQSWMIGRVKWGLKTSPCASITVKTNSGNETITNQCAMPTQGRLSILVCPMTSMRVMVSR